MSDKPGFVSKYSLVWIQKGCIGSSQQTSNKVFTARQHADHSELNAQVPASVPPGESQRHPPAALLHLQDVRLQRDPVHSGDGLSE